MLLAVDSHRWSLLMKGWRLQLSYGLKRLTSAGYSLIKHLPVSGSQLLAPAAGRLRLCCLPIRATR